MARWSIALVCLMLGGLIATLVSDRMLQGQAPTHTAVPKDLTSYRDVVKKVLPAVVSIEARAKVETNKAKMPAPKRRPRTPDLPPGVPEEFRKFFEEFEQSPFQTPNEQPQLGFGSGFIIDPKGVILTNYHVVDGAGSVEIELKDGRKFTSKDIHGDRKTDLAIIRIQSQSPLPYLELGDSDQMEIGDRVLAVGAPFGLTGSVTSGIISAKGRNGLRMNMYEDFLQTDAAINPGNSGGPLVNLEGQVIGINSAIKSRSGGFQGVGLAIASNMAKNVMEQLLRNGVVHRGYLGVQIRDLDPEVASRLGLKEQEGVLVALTFENAPAAKAGIQAGDVITAIGGKPVKDGRELQRIVAGLPLGKPVDVTVLHDGKSKVLQITIQEQPDEYGVARATVPQGHESPRESVTLDKVGVGLSDLSADMAEEFGYKENTKGALITSVESASPAYLAGLRRGMLITKVDKKAVASAKDAQQVLEKASLEKGVLLQVQSPQGGTNYVVLKVETGQ